MLRLEVRDLSLTRALSLSLVLMVITGFAIGQAQTGQWSTLPYTMPINPVHATLLNNGKVLVVSGSGNDPTVTTFRAAVWDPQSGGITTQQLSWDMFCNGMVKLPDGRVFVNSGTLQYDPFHGQLKSSVFDPATNTFTDVQNMAHGRWYPTVTVLGDGRVMTFSGLDENGNTNSSVEIYTVGSGWSQQYSSPWTPPLYPRMHLLPSGKVFYSGSTTTSRTFDPSTNSWSGTIATTNYSGTRTYGTSVLLPLLPSNNYDPRVMIMGGGNPATATTEIIDLGASPPTWQWGPNMSQARIEMNAVILPDGKVLALGGSVNDEDLNTVSYNADLYDPVANSFSSAGANAYPRLYHSVAILLPDATVWFAGGNPTRGTYEPHMEIYRPAYLYQSDGTAATRPTISSAPTSIGYGSSFTVQTPDAATISSVALLRPGSPTHAFDMDQRLVGLTFTAGSGALTVTAPPNGNVAPPGYYMLFLLNSSHVPSIASFVQVTNAQAPPDFSISATPSSQTVAPGNGANYTVTVTASGGFNGSVSLAASGLPQNSTATFNPTSVSGSGSSTLTVATSTSTPLGSYTITVAGTSGSLSHPVNVSLSVATPAPTVTAISPTTGLTTGGTAVTITGTRFVSGATVNFGGSAATNVTVVSSTSIRATTPPHAAGRVNVVVTNPGGQSGTLASAFLYKKK